MHSTHYNFGGSLKKINRKEEGNEYIDKNYKDKT